MPPHARRNRRNALLILIGTTLSLSMGCARTRVDSSLATAVVAGDVNAELDFWDALGARPVVCNDEGIHGLLLFVDKADPAATYEQRLEAARARGWIDDSWNEPGNLAMQRGVLARAITIHCKIDGGIMMRLLGPAPRYATRELQYLGMMGTGSEQQAVSGREYMGVISKAQDYLLLQQALREAEQKPAPADSSNQAGGTPTAHSTP